MNAIAKKLALAVGMLAIATGCATTSDKSAETQPPVNAAEVSNTQTVSQIKIDGSSTVYPITEAIANQFQQTKPQYRGQVKVDFSGTSGGFRKFCAKQTDISNASRPILQAEIDTCNKNGVKFIEIPVAFDALTITVHKDNSWAKDITVAELQKIWQPEAEGKITRWNQVRNSWPDQPINLYGAGKDSGTFDYFTEAIVGKSGASRNDYIASEDDLALVRGVAKDPNSLGYFGYAYYLDNKSQIKALAVNNGKGAVLPSRDTVEDSKYQPLSRPLFIYVNAEAVEKNPALKELIDYYIKYAQFTATSVGYVPLPSESYEIAKARFKKAKTGTLFAGKEQVDLTISDLLKAAEGK
jgi:phosphate transport system substrate-binding protein